MDLKATAHEYWILGANIVLLKGKEPLHKWSRWQTQRQTSDIEFESLPWKHADGFAVITGLKFENGHFFGAVDVDVKNVSTEAIGKGMELQKQLRITQTEQTPSGGKHFLYFSKKPIRSVNTPQIRDFCGVELLGERRLAIMAPSKGYIRLNDNLPTELEDLTAYFHAILKRIGFKPEEAVKVSIKTSHLIGYGKTRFKIRPCVKALFQSSHLAHSERVIITSEFFHAGYTQEQIESFFRDKPDSDVFSGEKTRYQVHHITTKPYRRYSCEKLRKLGLCLPECPIAEKMFQWKVDGL